MWTVDLTYKKIVRGEHTVYSFVRLQNWSKFCSRDLNFYTRLCNTQLLLTDILSLLDQNPGPLCSWKICLITPPQKKTNHPSKKFPPRLNFVYKSFEPCKASKIFTHVIWLPLAQVPAPHVIIPYVSEKTHVVGLLFPCIKTVKIEISKRGSCKTYPTHSLKYIWTMWT